jgi:acetyl-CoA carboxylase carboxyl transferase subunit alpha
MSSDRQYLDFERPVVELEKKIDELKRFSAGTVDFADEIRRLEKKARRLQEEIFQDLSAWQKVQLSRHSQRPYTLDYLGQIFEGFVELHGDRGFAEDPAIVSGFAVFDGRPVCVLGHQKGRSTKENVLRNFGMPRPEGYRKALRVMTLAARLGRPIICLIDTPGAYPGIGAEERGQAEAIARNLETMAGLPVPIIAVVIGEGGSGGALALGVADRIVMLEHSVYSVISPEGCASILWKDASRAGEAAAELKLTAQDLVKLGIADEVIPEVPGGAHRDGPEQARRVAEVLRKQLNELVALPTATLVERRYQKYRHMGDFQE